MTTRIAAKTVMNTINDVGESLSTFFNNLIDSKVRPIIPITSNTATPTYTNTSPRPLTLESADDIAFTTFDIASIDTTPTLIEMLISPERLKVFWPLQ